MYMGFIKVATASPSLQVGDLNYNLEQIQELVLEADKQHSDILVFPELSLTGYTCADLFSQELLLDKSLEFLEKLLNWSKKTSVLFTIGMPLLLDDKTYNCAILVKRGELLGVVPKMYIPNYKEFYEKRWFSSGFNISKKINSIKLFGKDIPFGNLIFSSDTIPNLKIGVEICEDLWSPIPPSSFLTIKGATIILNLSASNEVVSKGSYRHSLVAQQSGRSICGYIYSSAGIHESSTDLVFSGDCLIAENGSILNKSKKFQRENSIIYSEIDVDRLILERNINKTFADTFDNFDDLPITYVEFNQNSFNNTSSSINPLTDFKRYVDPLPFVPNNPATLNERCEEIFNIQVAGLAKRLEHTNCKNTVIGISGGLDSTLALIVTVKAYDLLNIPRKNITTITMPGFGTTDRTLNNALSLCKTLGTTLKEVNIAKSCLQHFEDIGHDKTIHDVTYENVQARERTQILMDTANKLGGLVIGTGDLSELALGWCTYNGDHMSMYAVNCSIPKTLVKFLVKWTAETQLNSSSAEILFDIIDTPVSPELLPPDKNGEILQKTEDIVGPYELHDFFLYHMIKYGASPKKILFLAQLAFKDKYNEEIIRHWLKTFYRRFFTQQFKRSCIPDGPKVGTISLSPRGDWRMPSDATYNLWLSELLDN